MIVAVTGPRRCGGHFVAVELMAAPLDEVMEFRTGAAFGVDSAAFYAALDLYPAALHVVVYPADLHHNRELVDRARRLTTHRVRVVPAYGTYRDRNVELIRGMGADDVLLAFPKTPAEERRGSGTWLQIRLARAAGIPIRARPLDGSPAFAD